MRVLPLLASAQTGLEISGKAFVVSLALVFILHVAGLLHLCIILLDNIPLECTKTPEGEEH